jgi:SOS response regulatory protein OraA/RecX
MRGQGPTPTLTAVRRSRPGRVALEVDGRPWRVVPDDVVVRCGLRPGLGLERPLLRDLRRELRRAEALDVAVRTVSRRDVSSPRLRERLGARGIASGEAQAAVETLSSAGVVDDARLARSRARALAERGWGDAAVAARLEHEGLPSEAVTFALAELPAESERASDVTRRMADPRKAWRFLARRGFAPETIEDVLGPLDAPR